MHCQQRLECEHLTLTDDTWTSLSSILKTKPACLNKQTIKIQMLLALTHSVSFIICIIFINMRICKSVETCARLETVAVVNNRMLSPCQANVSFDLERHWQCITASHRVCKYTYICLSNKFKAITAINLHYFPVFKRIAKVTMQSAFGLTWTPTHMLSCTYMHVHTHVCM